MNLRTMALAIALTMLPGALPSFAHHSTAMYNMATPTTVTGTVKRFEWTNPHARFYVDVKDEKQKKEEKEIEALWKKVCSDLDSLSSWNFRPKQTAPC